MTRPAEHRARMVTPLWIMAVLVAFYVGSQLRSPDPLSSALAQSGQLTGARGVYAFSGLLGPNRYGLFMMDIEQGTLWCYEIEPSSSGPKLKLTAARSWLYDRYLRDFNCASPDYRAVQQLVARQRDEMERSDPQEDERLFSQPLDVPRDLDD